MGEITWNELKSSRLKRTRGVSFEELLGRGKLVAVLDHACRPNQSLLVFDYKSYIWVVPCVISGESIFLKTLYPSRKHMKLYKRGGLK